jgi:hypothetical protein
MSNKAISAYAEALKRQTAEQGSVSQPLPRSAVITGATEPVPPTSQADRSVMKPSEVIVDEKPSPPPMEIKPESVSPPEERKIASKKESLQERKLDRLQESKKESFLAFLRSQLEVKPNSVVSFRYPEDLLDRLEQIQYAVRQQSRKKLTKNAILIAALAFLLWDYEQHDQESILYKHLVVEHG